MIRQNNRRKSDITPIRNFKFYKSGIGLSDAARALINKLRQINIKQLPQQLAHTPPTWQDELPELRQTIEFRHKMPSTNVTRPSVLSSELRYFPHPDAMRGSPELVKAKEQFATTIFRNLLKSYYREYTPPTGRFTESEMRLLRTVMSPDEIEATIRWLRSPIRKYQIHVPLINPSDPEEYEAFRNAVRLLEGYVEGKVPRDIIEAFFGGVPGPNHRFALSITPETKGLFRRYPKLFVPDMVIYSPTGQPIGIDLNPPPTFAPKPVETVAPDLAYLPESLPEPLRLRGTNRPPLEPRVVVEHPPESEIVDDRDNIYKILKLTLGGVATGEFVGSMIQQLSRRSNRPRDISNSKSKSERYSFENYEELKQLLDKSFKNR